MFRHSITLRNHQYINDNRFSDLNIDSSVVSRQSYFHHQRHPSSRCRTRVTNQGKEMRVAKLLDEEGLLDDDYIILDPDNPIPNPELGPLERRVSTTFQEGLTQEEIDPEAMKYWFTEPPQGWSTEKRRMRKAPVVQTDEIDDPWHPPSERASRRRLSELQVGDILQGTVVKHMLYHGIQVDVGFEVDGLIWVSEMEGWSKLNDGSSEERRQLYDIDATIQLVVHAINADPIFRFPLQLMPTDPELVALLPNPYHWIPPLDLRNAGVAEMPDIARRSGRKWEPQKVIVPVRENLEDMINNNEEEVTLEELAAIDEIAAMY